MSVGEIVELDVILRLRSASVSANTPQPHFARLSQAKAVDLVNACCERQSNAAAWVHRQDRQHEAAKSAGAGGVCDDVEEDQFSVLP